MEGGSTESRQGSPIQVVNLVGSESANNSKSALETLGTHYSHSRRPRSNLKKKIFREGTTGRPPVSTFDSVILAICNANENRQQLGKLDYE